jgi:hypothetical protein
MDVANFSCFNSPFYENIFEIYFIRELGRME